MVETYITMKVREALAAGHGNRAQAQRILIGWAMTDEQLLSGLCRPFLKAIAGAAVQRVARGDSAVPMPQPARAGAARRSAGAAASSAKQQPLTKEQLDALVATLGGTRDANLPPILNGAPMPKAEASDKQARSVKTLARAFVQKKF